MKHRKHRRSAAQKAATKKLVSLMKAKRAGKAPRVRKARHHKRRSLLSRRGRHRPVVKVSRGRLYRPKRSTIPSRSTFANPFMGELALIGNPMKRRHKAMKKHRKSRRSHRRSMTLFRNPMGALAGVTAGPREMIRMEFVKEAASMAVGFMVPGLLITRLPAFMIDATWKRYASKIVLVGLTSSIAGAITNKKVARAVLLGGGLSVLLDVYTDFIAPQVMKIGAPAAAPAQPAGTSVYYGTDGMETYYGDGAEMAGLAEAFAS
jgi:hypothetical protein